MIGAVLAGGLSRRMGTDKAGVILGDGPLWRRQMNVLGAAGLKRVVLVRRPEQVAPLDVECWRDTIAGIGPLAGLHAALAARVADFVAVLAVDMPGIGPEWFAWLSGACAEGAGAMARHADACEPLAAIYPSQALAAVEAQIAAKEHSLQRLANLLAGAGRMRLLPLGATEAPRTASLNTESELRAWRPFQGDQPATSSSE